MRINVEASTTDIEPALNWISGFIGATLDKRVTLFEKQERKNPLLISHFSDFLLAEGCDAGIRYEERLEQDMIAVPIGPRRQRFATAAAPAYLDRHGRPDHPRDLLDHACLRGRFANPDRPARRVEIKAAPNDLGRIDLK